LHAPLSHWRFQGGRGSATTTCPDLELNTNPEGEKGDKSALALAPAQWHQSPPSSSTRASAAGSQLGKLRWSSVSLAVGNSAIAQLLLGCELVRAVLKRRID
jgi:hypothetical protein